MYNILCNDILHFQRCSLKQFLILWDIETNLLKLLLPSLLASSLSASASFHSSSSSSLFSPIHPPVTFPELPETVLSEQQGLLSQMAKRYVTQHCWDPKDSRLLALSASLPQEGGRGTCRRREDGAPDEVREYELLFSFLCVIERDGGEVISYCFNTPVHLFLLGT